jgi:hypothetical protein
VEVYTVTRAETARLGQLTFYEAVNTNENGRARCGNITGNIPTLAQYDSRFTPAETAESGLAANYTNRPIIPTNIQTVPIQ